MVRIQNKQGDFKRGKQDSAVYQGFYGKQIRRKREDKKKTKSQKQLEVQQRFRDGLTFARSLSLAERETIESYIESHKLSLTWHNYAKLICMAPVRVDRSHIELPGSLAFPPEFQAWSYRKAINVVDRTGVSKTRFPVRIEIQGNDPSGKNFIDFSLVKPGGDDIRFTRSDSEGLFTYGIESWDSSSRVATIWVKMDSLPAFGTVPLFLYHDNMSAPPASDLESVLYG